MFKFVSAVLLVAIAIAAYFLLLPKIELNTDQLSIVNDSKPAASSQLENQEPEGSISINNTATTSMSPAETKEAKAHVASITAPPQTPIAIKTADHFVTADQILTLPAQPNTNVAIENISNTTQLSTTKAKLETLSDENTNNAESFALTLPTFKKITNKTNTEQVIASENATTHNSDPNSDPIPTERLLGTVTATIPKLSSNSNANDASSTAVNLSRPVFVTSNLVEDAASNTEQSNSVISSIKNNIEKLAEVNITELLADDNTTATVDKNANTIDINTTTQPDTVLQTTKKTDNPVNNNIKLRELLNDTLDNKKRIFYLHAVNPTDEQGIWGIIQKGLMSTFAKGIELDQGGGTLKTFIPNDADELLSSKKSSFLGKLLSNKVLTTYVYNYEKGNIGKNPNVIKPGQQLIIVTFSEEELLNVYQHFNQNGTKL